jgi:hypothetical protein
MIVPPGQSGPPLPEARAPRDAEPTASTGRASSSERAMLIAVAILLALLVAAAVILPHSPIAAEW